MSWCEAIIIKPDNRPVISVVLEQRNMQDVASTVLKNISYMFLKTLTDIHFYVYG